MRAAHHLATRNLLIQAPEQCQSEVALLLVESGRELPRAPPETDHVIDATYDGRGSCRYLARSLLRLPC